MYNVVKQNGRDVHIVIKPDMDCVREFRLGLHTRRPGWARLSFSEKRRGARAQQLTQPQVWRYGGLYPTSWDDALESGRRGHAAA